MGQVLGTTGVQERAVNPWCRLAFAVVLIRLCIVSPAAAVGLSTDVRSAGLQAPPGMAEIRDSGDLLSLPMRAPAESRVAGF